MPPSNYRDAAAPPHGPPWPLPKCCHPAPAGTPCRQGRGAGGGDVYSGAPHVPPWPLPMCHLQLVELSVHPALLLLSPLHLCGHELLKQLMPSLLQLSHLLLPLLQLAAQLLILFCQVVSNSPSIPMSPFCLTSAAASVFLKTFASRDLE